MKKVLIAIVTLAVIMADAATLTVTSNADSGAGSFRSALEDAFDGDRIVFNLPAGQTTITLSKALEIPYGRDLSVEGLVIDGQNGGRGVTLNGGDQTQIFKASRGGLLSISNLTFTAGYYHSADGGALYLNNVTGIVCNCVFRDNNVGGTYYYNGTQYEGSGDGGAVYIGYGKSKVHFEGCTFKSNTSTDEGGAIHSSGNNDIEITGCLFEDNIAKDEGGAIYATHYNDQGTLSVVDSTFLRNKTRESSGGSLYVSGTLSVNNCRFDGNEASTGENYADGGAIRSYGKSYIVNSTFVNNKAMASSGYGGAIAASLPSVIANCSFIGNGAGFLGGALWIPNFNDNSQSVVANCAVIGNKDKWHGGVFMANTYFINTVAVGNKKNDIDLDVSYYSGKVSLDYCIYGVSSGTFSGNPATCLAGKAFDDIFESELQTVTVRGVTHSYYPIKSGGLAANSGVYIWHNEDWSSVAYSLTPTGNKAYLSGNDSADIMLETDQIGHLIGTPSIGSTSLPEFKVTSNADSGAGTLREVLSRASDGDTITFDLPREASTITLSSRLSVGANAFTDTGIVIDGFNNGIGVTISGGDASGLFSFDGGNVVDFANINFVHARAAYGSAMDIYGSDVAFRNCSFTDNAATSSGAAIRNRSGVLTIECCSFSGNVAASSGGAIFTTGSSAATRLVNATFSGNAVSGSGSGGAINDAGGELTLLNCTFRGNQVNSGSGGGVYTRSPNLTIVNSLLVGNSASGNGKDIYTQYAGVAYKTFVGNCQGTLSGNAVTGKQESEVYSGTPLVTAVGGVSHAYCPLSASGIADGTGVFAWHDAEWTTIAYSESADGTPVIVRGSGDADVLVDCDQLGNVIGTPCVGAVNTCLLMVTSNADSGAGSLRNVLADAVDGDVIAFDLPAESNVIAVASTLQLPENRFGTQGVTIDGYNGGNGVVLDGGGSNALVRVNYGNSVTLENVVFRNAIQSISMGRYDKVASVHVKNCTFENNRKNSAVSNNHGIFDAENCLFRNNISTAAGSPGAIENIGAKCVVRNCSFVGNRATTGHGGAIEAHTTQLLVIGCTFSGNASLDDRYGGGAIMQLGNGSSASVIANSTFASNQSAFVGGGVECAGATMYMVNNVLVDNSAPRGGADTYNSGTLLMYNCVYGSASGNINGDKESNFPGKTAADVFSGGLATRAVDGVTHSYYPTLPSGFAAGPGIYLWHNDDWSAIAYTREARGVKTYILGNEGADSRLLDDQLGATITGYASIGAIFTPHEHANTYSAEGNVLTESCTCRHKETATVTAANATYDGTAHETGSVAYSRDWLAGALNIAYANNVNAGTATASISQGGATASAEFTIAKRALTITAKPKTLTVYLIDPEGNDPVTVSGLQGGDTLETLDGTLELTYKLIPSGKTSQNYDISYVGGLVTVQKKPVALSASGSALKAYATLADAVADTETVKYGMTVLVPDGWTEAVTLPAGVTLGLQTGTDASGIVVNAPASYYRVVTNEDGCVKFELDPEEATPVIASDGEEAAFVVGDGDTVSVNVTNVKGGLYYGLAWSDTLDGEFAVSAGGWVQASVDGNLPALTAPKGEGNGRFYRVRVADDPNVVR